MFGYLNSTKCGIFVHQYNYVRYFMLIFISYQTEVMLQEISIP